MEENNPKTDQNSRYGTTPTQNSIEAAVTMFKRELQCPYRSGKDTSVTNGNTRYNGKVIRCTVCSKQISGNNVVELLNDQLGQWEHGVSASILSSPTDKDTITEAKDTGKTDKSCNI